jgi:two-component system response regulator TtrR
MARKEKCRLYRRPLEQLPASSNNGPASGLHAHPYNNNKELMNHPSQTVYIVDDNPAVRDSLTMLMSAEGLAIQAFASAAEFLAICCVEMRGCCVLDIQMPQMSGMELQRQLIERGITIPIIFLTGHGDIPLASSAFRSGAFDFLEKPFAIDTLLERVRQALFREAEQWHVRYRQKLLRDAYSHLSQREKEVLKWVAAGYSSKEIASIIGISSRTVDVHRAHIMEKMGARSLADLVAQAMEIEGAAE